MKIVLTILLFFSVAVVYAGDFDTRLKEAFTLLDSNKMNEAEALFISLDKEQADNPEILYGLAVCALSKKEFDRSVELCEKAITFKKDARYYYILGAAYGSKAQKTNVLKQLGLVKKIRAAFEEACKLNPTYLEPRLAMIQFHLQAPGIAGGSIKEAFRYADEIEIFDKINAMFARASIYESEKEYANAIKEYKNILSKEPASENAYIGLINAYILAKDGQNALLSINSAEKILSGKPVWLYMRGKISAECGIELDTGARVLQEYIDKKPTGNLPKETYAYWRLGMIAEWQKNTEKAKEYYTTALTCDKNNKNAQKALEKLTKKNEKKTGR